MICEKSGDSVYLRVLKSGCYPSQVVQLIEKQGWKIVDLTEEKRVHMSTVLERLCDRVFANTEEVSAKISLSSIIG